MGIDQIPNFMTDSEKRTCVRFQMQDSTLLKSLISFLKIVFLCAAHKNIIATFYEKKIGLHISYCVSAFSSSKIQCFNFLKKFHFNCQNRVSVHREKIKSYPNFDFVAVYIYVLISLE